MIRLEPYNKEYYEALAYDLDKDQVDFTGRIDYCVNEKKVEEDDMKTIVVILYQDVPVGFFVLDRGEDKYTLTKNKFAVLLRSFSINPKYQGKGIGIEAMNQTVDFVKENMPEVNEIVLAVNIKNEKAYNVYINAGYVDKKINILGKKGMLNILSKEIPMEQMQVAGKK